MVLPATTLVEGASSRVLYTGRETARYVQVCYTTGRSVFTVSVMLLVSQDAHNHWIILLSTWQFT